MMYPSMDYVEFVHVKCWSNYAVTINMKYYKCSKIYDIKYFLYKWTL